MRGGGAALQGCGSLVKEDKTNTGHSVLLACCSRVLVPRGSLLKKWSNGSTGRGKRPAEYLLFLFWPEPIARLHYNSYGSYVGLLQ